LQKYTKFCTAIFHSKSYASISAENGLGYILDDFYKLFWSPYIVMGFAKQAIETYQAFVKLVEESLADLKIQKHIIIKSYRPIPRRDSISRPIAPQAETLPLDHGAKSNFYKSDVQMSVANLGLNFG
jgi:hypothetical protein